MTATFSNCLARWRIATKKLRQKGFTLLELLVAVLIGGIITSSLLFLVIELLRVDTREETLTQVQQDMRRALDYINSDLSEAVYIYLDPSTVIGQLSDLPAGATPIIAFWRLDPLDEGDINSIGACSGKGAQEDECSTLKVRQAYYTLVVYLHQTNAPDSIWGGPSRIIRYSLPKYTGDIANLNQRAGYADPTLPIVGSNPQIFNSFESWVSSGNTDGEQPVLVDYVNLPNSINNTCDVDKDGTPDANTLSRPFPATSNSFYVCVRTGSIALTGASDPTQTNQSIIVYLQGNAEAGSAAVNNAVSANSRLPRLESEVFVRGVLEEFEE